MEGFFSPSSVAVVGASRHPHKVGHIVFRNLLRSFRGQVYPVNIKGGTILGRRAYKRLSDLPERPDLVVVAIPAPGVPAVIREAGMLGTKYAIILSGGFGEVGNNELDRELLEASREYGMRLLGPNCIGLYTPNLNATFLTSDRMDFPPPGRVAILSQSGALMAALLDVMAERGIGVRAALSLGNKLLLDEVDFLNYFIRDGGTDVIVLYLESVRRGRELYNLVRHSHKPVIVLKGGRTSEGLKAATSHTEALLNDYDVFHGAMRQAGAIEVETPEDALYVLEALFASRPRGRRLLILTNGGGYGVLATDLATRYGFELPPWRDPLPLPPHVVQSNPFDLTGDAEPSWYRMVVEAARDYDAILAIVIPQTPRIDPSIVHALTSSPVPLYAVVPGGRYAAYLRETFRKHGIPVFSQLGTALRALSSIVR